MTPYTMALNVELAPELVERIRAAAPDCRVLERAELSERAPALDECEIVFTNSQLDPGRVARSTRLRWLQANSAGVEWLLTPEVLARPDLQITSASGIHAQPLAEHVFAWMLSFARNLHLADRKAREQRWDPEPLRKDLRTLEGKTLGILGLGAIGLRLAEIGAAFRMRVLGMRRLAGPAEPPVERVYGAQDLMELLGHCDYVVDALPLTPATRHLLGAPQLAAMRPGALLINIGRGGTVDTVALVEALSKGQLGGAALDVTDPEPLPPQHALWRFDNVLISPHYGGAHPGYDEHAVDILLENLRRFRTGEPLRNLVDPARGY